ncbi:MAG: undecaprenyl-diphosphate phosphatase [Bacteroidetes bacterium]|nr:undecaprenyl-diphosphate phosphatase [Rhodothermia bacterium]MCS7154313.1 undecaprenyl-diphosphate phosphatase [Bacteroidota bacterium]MCX7906651.1 undecaprenyl-diphosphate phosphatase [Bacteroidota bacterium]MDW8137069.1 undecaprenyl-diphosphate phosphatase [Bacteroidota bacterium]MDW8285060.1 undecaprenyl-diphosphate phosphatase [Bacteroidota bacterium]
MTIWEGLLLGLLQGLTEFLPISSSGHLVLGEHLLGLRTDGITFEIMVHFGTTLSVLTYFGRDLWAMLRGALRWLLNGDARRVPGPEVQAARWIGYIALATIPSALVGLGFRDAVEAAFANPRLVAGMLLVTGTLLLLTKLRQTPGTSLSAWRALLVGLAQAAAITPGISRSGATVAMALYLGVERETAARFSFLLLLPVVLGATLLEVPRLGSESAPWGPVLVGTAAAYLSGLLAIYTLLAAIRRGRLEIFAGYCYLVGLLGLIAL